MGHGPPGSQGCLETIVPQLWLPCRAGCPRLPPCSMKVPLALSSTTTAFLPGDCGAHFCDPAPVQPRLLPQSSPHGPEPLSPGPLSSSCLLSPAPVSPALFSPLDPNISEPSTLGLGPRPVLPVPFQLGSSGSRVSALTHPHPSPASCIQRSPFPGPASLRPLTPVWSQSPRGLPQFLTCTPLRLSPPPLCHL